jgi:hypothetical protein
MVDGTAPTGKAKPAELKEIDGDQTADGKLQALFHSHPPSITGS